MSDAQELSKSPEQREKLDVETSAERQERLGRLFTSPNLSSSPPSATSITNPFPTMRPDIGPLPQSDLLARIRAFLPQMESSNKDLLQRAKDNPGEVDIENTSGQGQVIEMDLGLGVYDVKGNTKGDMGPELDIPKQRQTDEDEEDDEDDDEDEEMEDRDVEDISDSDTSSSEESDSSSINPPNMNPVR